MSFAAPLLTDYATAVELRAVLSAARRLLDRLSANPRGLDARTAVEALADDLDAIATHPTTAMAAEVVRHVDTLANPDAAVVGMTVGDALATMARLGFYDPKRLAS